MTRLGDLLIEAGVVKEEDFLRAMEISAYKSKLIGDILIETSLITRSRLQAALELQRLIRMGLVVRNQAIATLRAVDEESNVAAALEKNSVDDARKRLLASEAFIALVTHLTGLDFEELVSRVHVKCKSGNSNKGALPDEAPESSHLFAAHEVLSGSAGSAVIIADPLDSDCAGFDSGVLAAEFSSSEDLTDYQNGSDSSPGDQNEDLIGAGDDALDPDSPQRKRLRQVAEQLYLDVLNGACEVEQAMIILNLCLKDDCSVAEAVARMGWTVGVRPFKEVEMNFSDADLIDWLTQED
jgi:hypothetical protein